MLKELGPHTNDGGVRKELNKGFQEVKKPFPSTRVASHGIIPTNQKERALLDNALESVSLHSASS